MTSCRSTDVLCRPKLTAAAHSGKANGESRTFWMRVQTFFGGGRVFFWGVWVYQWIVGVYDHFFFCSLREAFWYVQVCEWMLPPASLRGMTSLGRRGPRPSISGQTPGSCPSERALPAAITHRPGRDSARQTAPERETQQITFAAESLSKNGGSRLRRLRASIGRG